MSDYEMDLGGRVRRTIEGARASADQSVADLENTRLLRRSPVAGAMAPSARADPRAPPA